MTKLLVLMAALIVGFVTYAQEPARRPHPKFSYSPAHAVCKDDTYKCMYNCTVVEGEICTPTRGSDPNCPLRKISGGHRFSTRLVVLMFEGYHDMGCQVTSLAKTNMVCGTTKYGWDCWPGHVHNR